MSHVQDSAQKIKYVVGRSWRLAGTEKFYMKIYLPTIDAFSLESTIGNFYIPDKWQQLVGKIDNRFEIEEWNKVWV